MEVDLIVWSKPQTYSKKQMGGFMLHIKVSHEVCAGQCGDGKQMQVDEMICSPSVIQLIEKVYWNRCVLDFYHLLKNGGYDI